MKKKDNFLNNLVTYTKKGFEDGLVIGCTTPFISFLVYGIFQDMTVNEAVKLSGIFFGSTTVGGALIGSFTATGEAIGKQVVNGISKMLEIKDRKYFEQEKKEREEYVQKSINKNNLKNSNTNKQATKQTRPEILDILQGKNQKIEQDNVKCSLADVKNSNNNELNNVNVKMDENETEKEGGGSRSRQK